jgi:hypothetical protein
VLQITGMPAVGVLLVPEVEKFFLISDVTCKVQVCIQLGWQCIGFKPVFEKNRSNVEIRSSAI